MLVHLWGANIITFLCGYFELLWQHKRWLQADLGLYFTDGRRLIGPHKTYLVLIPIIAFTVSLGYFISSPYLGLLYGLGMYVGSLILSFIKRRFAIKQGDRLVILDQIDYILGTALVFIVAGESVVLPVFLCSILISIPVHSAANLVAHQVGLKKVPW